MLIEGTHALLAISALLCSTSHEGPQPAAAALQPRCKPGVSIRTFAVANRQSLDVKLLQNWPFFLIAVSKATPSFKSTEGAPGVEIGWNLTLCKLVYCEATLTRLKQQDCNLKPLEDMGKQFNTWIVFLVFFASDLATAAQSPKAGTEEFSFLGFGSNDSCANADCMQGTCVPNDNLLLSVLFPYTCKCNPGWSTLAKVIPFLEVPSLPCNVPNCSLNLNCSGKSPAPAPGPSAPITSANSSSCLVPGICGHGKCVITSMENSLVPTFKCVCDPGYANVLNMTSGFCVNHCEIDGSCQNLNITLPGLGSPPPPPPPAAGNETANAGCRSQSFQGGYYLAAALVLGWSSLRML